MVKRKDGSRVRIFGTPTLNTKEAAEQAERDHIARVQNPPAKPVEKKEVPKFGVFAKEFMSTYALANNKPSEQRAKQNILDVWLLPRFKSTPLNEIRMREIETLKANMLEKKKSPKRINNTITVLGKILRYAAELELIDSVPRIKLLRVPPQRFDFLDFEELQRLLEAAESDPEIRVAILCGVDAGLRSGEIKGLEWGDLDLKVGLLSVRRSLHRGILTSPKSGRERTLPMTERLRAELKDLRHLKGEAVFCKADGGRYTRAELDWRLMKVCRKAQLRWIGWHALRHTFCSHLAMRGAPPRTIQELAGHSSLGITQRYMHLTPGAAKEAIRMLEGAPPWHPGGTRGEPVGESEGSTAG
jgi:integrase